MLCAASKVRVPIAFVAKLPETNVQLTPLPESALSVRHTPPPAAAAQTRHPLLLQLGSMASAVIRPEVVYAAPLKVRTLGKFSELGPASVHAPPTPGACGPLAAARALAFAQERWASRVNVNGTYAPPAARVA